MHRFRILVVFSIIIFAISVIWIVDETPLLYDFNNESSEHSSSLIKSTDMNTSQPEPIKRTESTPIHDIVYVVNGTNSNRSVFVVPRRAYYDTRLVYGKPRNIVVIISEVHDDALKSIVGCELNGNFTKSINILKEQSFTGWVRRRKPGYTHRIVVVECLGYPAEFVTNGSTTKLLYIKQGDDYYSRVETEAPLVRRSSLSTPTRGKGSIVVCTTVYSKPDTLEDWLRYQKTLGVDMVHMSADITFDENSYPFLLESIQNGFVQYDIWNNIVGSRMYNRGQILKYQNCLYRYLGVFEFGMFYDVDDFFIPRLPRHKAIHYYFNNAFSKNNNIGTVLFIWKQLLCSLIKEQRDHLPDGNLTSIVTGSTGKWRQSGKCAHRLSGTLLIDIHYRVKSQPGYVAINYSKHKAYIMHHKALPRPDCRTLSNKSLVLLERNYKNSTRH